MHLCGLSGTSNEELHNLQEQYEYFLGFDDELNAEMEHLEFLKQQLNQVCFYTHLILVILYIYLSYIGTYNFDLSLCKTWNFHLHCFIIELKCCLISLNNLEFSLVF